MIPLSATSALDPAIARTRRLLTLRRSWKTALKLAFIAIFAELGGGFNFNFNLGNHAQQSGPIPQVLAIGLALGYAVIFAIFFLIGLTIFYIGSRLQFVVFDLILRQDTLVAPSWRLFGQATWRWIGIRILVLLGIGVLFSPLLIPMIIGFVHVVSSNAAQTHPGAFFSLLFGYVGTILLVAFVMFLVFTIVRSFGLPAIVMENTGVAATFRRSFEIFGANPGQSLLYLLLQIVLRIVMMIGGYIAFLLVAMISAIPPGIVGVVLYFILHGHGTGGKVLMVAGFIVLGVLWFVCIMIAGVYLFGAMELFLCAYSIYFVAGRYPPLGAILVAQEPQLAYPAGYRPPPPIPPVQPPPPEMPPAA